MSTREDLKIYPCFVYFNDRPIKLVEVSPFEWWNQTTHQVHHYVRQQQFERNPEKFKKIQKLILVPIQMHLDIHSRHSKFFEKYGVNLEEVLYLSKY